MSILKPIKTVKIPTTTIVFATEPAATFKKAPLFPNNSRQPGQRVKKPRELQKRVS
jgi:hypothetical protein